MKFHDHKNQIRSQLLEAYKNNGMFVTQERFQSKNFYQGIAQFQDSCIDISSYRLYCTELSRRIEHIVCLEARFVLDMFRANVFKGYHNLQKSTQN